MIKNRRFQFILALSIAFALIGWAQAIPARAQDGSRGDQPSAPNSFVDVNAVNTGASALSIAQAMATDASIVSSASFVTRPPANVTGGVIDTAYPGFPINGSTYGILSSGDANMGIISTNLGGGGIRGNTDGDVTILQVNLNVPSDNNCLSFDFRFLSREYPVYVSTEFNDAFIAEINTSTWTTAGSTISAPNNFAFDPNGNVVSINATGPALMNAANAAGTPFSDYGATSLVRARTQIGSGAQTLFLSIFDQGDQILDSVVFIDNLTTFNTADSNCTSGLVDPSLVVVVPGCALNVPSTSVVGEAPAGARVYYEPGKLTESPAITLNPGTYWVIGQDTSETYYKIVLACQFRWVLKDTMGPNYDTVWNGRPLPTLVVS